MSEFTDDDAVAAEYVLGTLARDEHDKAEARRIREPAFDRLVQEWTQRFEPLLEATPEVQPDPRLRETILAEIDRLRSRQVGAAASGVNVVQLRRQVAQWRLATALCASLAAVLAVWVVTTRELPFREGGQYLAVLQQGGGAPAFLVSVDMKHVRMTVVPSAAVAEPNKSLELWMIGAGAGAPQSLGLVDTTATVRPHLPDVNPDLISQATYAITLEPKGGSPNGKPSAAPVFVGHLIPVRSSTAGG